MRRVYEEITSEGLDQDFTSLDVQREAAEESEEFRVFTVGGDSEPWWRDYERNLGWKIF